MPYPTWVYDIPVWILVPQNVVTRGGMSRSLLLNALFYVQMLGKVDEIVGRRDVKEDTHAEY